MKKSRFFCENCHREVKPSAKVCPHCGRFFTAVRCPSCSYVGESADFVNGCPSCGYAAGVPGQDAGFETVDLNAVGRPAAREHRKTPGWVLPLAAVIIVAVFAVLVVVYLRL